MVLPNVLSVELFFCPAVQRGGDVQYGRTKLRVTQRESFLRLGPTEVNSQGFLVESATQVGRKSSGIVPVEIPALSVPSQLAFGQQDEHLAHAVVRHPPSPLPLDPVGTRRGGRRKQKKKLRFAEGSLDGTPQRRVGG